MSRQQKEPKSEIEWNFYSFPVAFAFFFGAFVAVLLYPLGFFVFFISLFAVSFGTAHILGRWWRRRVITRARTKADENERERRALAARASTSRQNVDSVAKRKRRRSRGGGPSNSSTDAGAD